MQRRLLLKMASLFLVILVLLAGGVVIAVKSVNLDQVKALLTAQVQTATGRTLTISGPLDFRLGLIPRIVADGVTFSNPPGASRPEMVKIKHFEMEISLLPLLKHEILINQLIVTAPDILIETEAKGPGNLNFSNPNEKIEPKPSPTDSSSSYRFSLHKVAIKDGVVVWHDRSTGQTETVKIQTLTVQPDRKSAELLAIQLVTKARDRMIELTGTVGKLNTAIGGTPWPINLKAGIEGLTLSAEGTVAELFAFHGLDLHLTAQGAELHKMVELAGISKPEMPQVLGPFKLSARLRDAAAGSFSLSDINAEIGKPDLLLFNAKGSVKDLLGAKGVGVTIAMECENPANLSSIAGTDLPALGPVKLTGLLQGGGATWKLTDFKTTVAGNAISGEIALNGAKRPHLSGKISADTLNLNDFTKVAQSSDQSPHKPTQPAGNDGRVFSNQPLPFDALQTVDMDVTAQIGKLITGEIQLNNFATELHLQNGQLTIKPFHTDLAGGTVEGAVDLNATGKVAVATLHLTARQVELGVLTHNKTIKGGKSDLKVDLKGQGNSVRALMSTMTGETVLSVGKGKLENKAVNWAAGDLLFQVLGALNPLAKSEDSTSLTCAVVHFTLRDGIATADKGIGVRTDKVDVVGSGTVDLRSETLDLGIHPSPRHGVGLSLTGPLAGMTRLRGTFTNPSIGIDSGGTLRSAASMGAAAATGGLSLLGELVVDKISADSDPCRTALGHTSAQQKRETPKQKDNNFLQNVFGR